MLKSLYISSFVIIDEVQIDFHDGMSALTGETGAGKSIIVDAIGQLVGNRTQSQFIKKGAKKAVIEGVFEVSERFSKICDEYHLRIEDEIVVTKEIFANGKSNVKINYRNVSLTVLKLIMPYLIDIHSQFETQALFIPKKHIELLDHYIQDNFNQLKENYVNHYDEYKSLIRKLDKVINEDLSDEQIEFYESQIKEIEECEYSDENIAEFENELKRLENYEKMNEVIHVFDDNMNNRVLLGFKEAIYNLSQIQDDDFIDYHDNLYNQYYDVKDTYESIMDLYQSFHFDEYRFNELQEILYKVNRLKRKYGYSMLEIQEAKEDILSKIEMINHREEYIDKLKIEIKDLESLCLKEAEKIHDIRVENAKKFEKEMANELIDLYLPYARFHINIEKVDLNKNGYDNVTLMVSTNKGQDLSPLNETASGGEISRIMLAIKTIILKDSDIDTILFDEVDTGVSGKVASGIGEKMRKLSESKQVICITHLPQVAACSTYQYAIVKETNDVSTVSSIHLLDKKGRIEELAKMLSGDHISEEARKNAEKLLDE